MGNDTLNVREDLRPQTVFLSVFVHFWCPWLQSDSHLLSAAEQYCLVFALSLLAPVCGCQGVPQVQGEYFQEQRDKVIIGTIENEPWLYINIYNYI